ncbi:hypothetical protein TBLA_0G02490 [Henningerozyma blattae CBS 6284]|uniref:protein-histidine N-methyltransferase n=1 Tax=Henningerozyma blattae (strain ATCC 34711 / CBS 6284 / DSM 70876 / NBRC 10599 / NRRL Y-10934 / UCD 77-7) TaxID=1071380 RepID=I2H736_HENB6|nr:hypothetical protein TBLA_0G02490 [Tetrapisispora blattae CBS 6284]CCH62188.1 hypothetical protein TBLA_0G02490 [Tetrapisispora blattae CBS 6284]
MSFTFDFTSDDFSEDEFISDTNCATIDKNKSNPLDEERLLANDIVQPKFELLSHILQSLKDVRVSFEQIFSAEEKAILYRRELFDVKHQLMSEVDDVDASNENHVELDILIGDTSEDLRKNIYEGGLKSWECSIDLVDLLNKEVINPTFLKKFDNLIELGCGTSLPTEFLFGHYLKSNSNDGLKILLSDYNYSVLRLVSIPNLVITWAKFTLSETECEILQKHQDENMPIRDDEIQFSAKLLETFHEDLKRRNITIELVSGSWGRKFSNLTENILKNSSNLVLTSETIYQPITLPVVAETILDYLRIAKDSQILVAAKDIYFGVGGSIIEFENYLEKRNNANKLNLRIDTFKVSAGLKRSIMLIDGQN